MKHTDRNEPTVIKGTHNDSCFVIISPSPISFVDNKRLGYETSALMSATGLQHTMQKIKQWRKSPVRA